MNEKQLSVPWGQITYKCFGNNLNPPVLLLHDMHDNAASFDQVLPNLSSNFYYVAIDLPGHGKSSHAPKAAMYHYMDYTLAIKYAVYALFKNGNTKIILIGHAAGAHLAIVFAQIYPELVAKLVLLDDVYDYGIEASELVTRLRQHHELYLKMLTKTPQECTLAQIKDVYLKKYGERNEIVDRLAERASNRIANDVYVLRHDVRLAGMLMHTEGHDYAIDLIKKQSVLCPVLIIINSGTKQKHKELLFALKHKTKRVIRVVKMQGEHFHITQPKETVRHVNSFLDIKMANKL